MMPFTSFTVQVRVPDIGAGLRFYSRLFGRDPDLTPHADFHEWEIRRGGWLQLASGAPDPERPIRFGVPAIEAARALLADTCGIACTPAETVPGVVLWCDFADPWGNRLGFYEVLDGSED